MDPTFALVITRGASPEIVAAHSAAIVVAADGGVDVARSADLRVDVVVGDLDSATADALRWAETRGARVERHSTDKDESDLELALALVAGTAAARVHVVAATGGRLDHQLANLLVLASPRWSALEVTAQVGADRVWVVRGERELPLAVGEPLALHAVGGPATVDTTGLRFELDHERLDALVARGIANEVRATPVRIRVDEGVVLAISSQSAQAV